MTSSSKWTIWHIQRMLYSAIARLSSRRLHNCQIVSVSRHSWMLSRPELWEITEIQYHGMLEWDWTLNLHEKGLSRWWRCAARAGIMLWRANPALDRGLGSYTEGCEARFREKSHPTPRPSSRYEPLFVCCLFAIYSLFHLHALI